MTCSASVHYSAPILAYARFYEAFSSSIPTLAWIWPLGLSSYQIHDDGTDAVIAYISRSLTKAETHYPNHKLEFLALKWDVVEKFHEYLYGLSLQHIY